MMSYAKIMSLASFLGIFLMAGGCKKTSDSSQSAGSSTGYGKCSCTDIECWDELTKKSVTENIQCAKTAGSGALLAYSANLMKFVSGTTDVVTAIHDDGFQGLIAEVTDEISGTKVGDRYKKVQCLKKSRSSLTSFMRFFKGMDGISQDASPTVVLSIIKTSLSGINGAIKFVDNAKQCFTGTSPEDKVFKKITGGISNIMRAVAIFTTMKDCGFAISKGGAILFNNTQCLVEDLGKLEKAEAKLASMHESNAYKPSINNTDSSLCNDQPIACNTFAMGKYGSYLYNKTYWGSRAYDCAELCGNYGSRKTYCQEANSGSNGIFKNSPNCSKTCGTKQCQNAINICVSYCCRQDGVCVDKAHDDMEYYNL